MNNTDIAHLRLHRQGLSKIIFKDANDAVTQLGAVQAQDYAGAKWALGLRLKDANDASLDQAFADGSFLRTHLLRPTWHFVTPTDIRWLLMLTAPRVHAVNAFMYRKLELDKAVIKKSYIVLEKALRGNNYLTRTELGSIFEKAGIKAEGQRLGYFMMSAELDGVICSGPRKGKQFTYALLEERIPKVKNWKREEALAELVRRYFSTRGPATLQDFTWWSGLTMTDARNGIEMVRSWFVSEVMDGQTYWFTESKLPAKKKSPTAYFLPNYDEYFIGFKDRSAIGEVAKQAGVRSDDPALLAHIIILDGQIVGGWKRTMNKNSVTVEANLIAKLTKTEEKVIHEAAERFGNFIELPLEFNSQESDHEQRKTRSF
jgi:hypothetical protein